jgi:hypothetical protein
MALEAADDASLFEALNDELALESWTFSSMLARLAASSMAREVAPESGLGGVAHPTKPAQRRANTATENALSRVGG